MSQRAFELNSSPAEEDDAVRRDRRAAVREPRRLAEAVGAAEALGLLDLGSEFERALSVGKISAKCCSFSAVSAPIFARKYAFCSIFQNLPDSQAEIFEI